MGEMRSASRNKIMAQLLVLATPMVLSEILRLPSCSKFDGEFSVKVDGRVLVREFLLMRLKSISYFDCLHKCVSHTKCKSLNYSPGSKLCELNSKDSRDSNVVYEQRRGWSFYETPHAPVDNLGPICHQLSPCKHGKCKDICSEPGYICTCDYGYLGPNCDSMSLGLKPEIAASSCLQIRNQHGSKVPPSGMYWIKTPKPVSMYCDMEVDGGGWTKIGNMNITSNDYSYDPSLVHVEPETLHLIERPYYALSTAGLAKLRHLIGFTSIRMYCYKPSVGRTIHIFTADNSTGMEVVKYMTGSATTRPPSCNSYVKLPDDTSELSKDCSRWAEAKWSHVYVPVAELLYWAPAYISGKHHIVVGSPYNRFECDDSYQRFKIGFWMFFVR